MKSKQKDISVPTTKPNVISIKEYLRKKLQKEKDRTIQSLIDEAKKLNW